MYLAQGHNAGDAGEAWSHNPTVSSQALYHWATALQLVPYASGEGQDKPAFLPSLIRAFPAYIYKVKTFVCFVALRPKSTAMVIAGWSVHLATLFPGQAWTSS